MTETTHLPSYPMLLISGIPKSSLFTTNRPERHTTSEFYGPSITPTLRTSPTCSSAGLWRLSTEQPWRGSFFQVFVGDDGTQHHGSLTPSVVSPISVLYVLQPISRRYCIGGRFSWGRISDSEGEGILALSLGADEQFQRYRRSVAVTATVTSLTAADCSWPTDTVSRKS